MEGKIVTLVGIAGSGKTTLGNNLSKRFGIQFLEEDWKSIPAIHEKHATNLAVCMGFLHMRREQIVRASQIKSHGKNVIIDTIFEMTDIYSRLILNDEEYAEFKKHYDILYSDTQTPDLYIYLTGEMDVIRHRALDRKLGVKMEETMLSLENLVKAKASIESLLRQLHKDKVLEIDVVNEDIRMAKVLDSIAHKAKLI